MRGVAARMKAQVPERHSCAPQDTPVLLALKSHPLANDFAGLNYVGKHSSNSEFVN